MKFGFFGHHKCATSWINGIIEPLCVDLGINFCSVNTEEKFNFNLYKFVQTHNIDFLSYTNADWDYIKGNKNFKAFHVIRDPRDIIISGYFSHMYSHSTKGWPELIEHRAKLKELPKKEGLFLEFEFSKNYLNHLEKWDYNQENILEIKMENLIQNPYEIFVTMFDFLQLIDHRKSNLLQIQYSLISMYNHALKKGKINGFRIKTGKISAEKVLSELHKKRFSKLAQGRGKGLENKKSHYRKGTPNDWKNHFDQDHIDYFKEKFNHLLIKLEYERNEDWEE